METTLNKIRAHEPCQSRWKVLLSALGKTQADDEPLSFAKIIDILGLDDALWCTRSTPEYAREWRKYAIWCARQVQHLMADPRSIAALDTAERYACGKATRPELAAAWAARAAARAARAAQEKQFRGIIKEREEYNRKTESPGRRRRREVREAKMGKIIETICPVCAGKRWLKNCKEVEG